LRRQADEFVDLTQMVTRIGRDPGERAERAARQGGEQRRPHGHLVTSAQLGDEVPSD